MLPHAIRTGISEDSDLRAAHNAAIAIGAVRAFCANVYKHMCIINAIVKVDSAKELFTMGAKYELMREGSSIAKLEDIVIRVFESADGVPTFPEMYNDTLQHVMQDYTRARQAALSGRDSLGHYQRSIMTPYITDVSDIEGCVIDDSVAEQFMHDVEQCCCMYDNSTRNGPLFNMLANAIQ